MNKALLFLILSLSLDILKCGTAYNGELYTCPDDDFEVTNVCAMKNVIEPSVEQILIGTKCGKASHCKKGEDGQYYCLLNPKYRKVGKSCTYNEDCMTGICNKDGKCEALKEGGDCSQNGNACAAGYKCDTGVCKKYKYENEDCSNCAPGFSCVNLNGEDKCHKWGSLDKGKACQNDEDCKSGICIGQECSDLSGITISECDKSTNKAKFTENGSEKTMNCISYNTDKGKKYTPEYSQLKTKLWKDYLDDIKDVDFKKVIEDEENRDKPDGSFGKFKYFKKYALYKYAETFRAMGYIDKDGEVESKCEVDFIVKNVLSSSYLKYSFYFSLLLAFIGF